MLPTFASLSRVVLENWLETGARRVRLCLVRNRRARRYILRLRPDGSARVTIPRGGSETEARRFANRHLVWIEKQLQRPHAIPPQREQWSIGSEILFRGEPVRIQVGPDGTGTVCFGSETLPEPFAAGNLRPAIEHHLRALAARELPVRVLEFAAQHQLDVKRVSVRNQRSRWGSCSRRGTISLNWRLVQAPELVRDYIILHELMHLRQMNHSPRFWREVESVCPCYREAEGWLKQHAQWFRR